MLVSLGLDQHIEDLAFGVNRPPEIDQGSADVETGTSARTTAPRIVNCFSALSLRIHSPTMMKLVHVLSWFDDLAYSWDDLEETVDAALRFIDEGKLEEIETAARHLIERYPDIPDGWEFLGHVHEKRGENREAVACYRRVLEIVDRTPDDFDPEYTQRFVDQIAKLDPPQTT